ncbi:unnamed protein product, partial [Rotaria magnacalcarata]
MHKCYTDDTSITLTSTTMSSSSKDISLDSLDSPQSKEQVTPPAAAAATFCRSETYDKVVIKSTLPVIIDDLDDSTSSASSTC